MRKLEFAVFDEFGFGYFRSVPEAVDIYEQTFREVQLEEKVGFKYHFVIEHQSANVGQCQTPTVYLAALARHTSKIRIGAMIFLIPFYNPLRLAMDCAMIDQLSHGRLEFGAGMGAFEHEFDRWGLDFANRRELVPEAMEIIVQAWTQDAVTYEGKLWKYDKAVALPKPYQKPHPPIWFAGTSRGSLEYSVAHGYHIGMGLLPDEDLADTIRLWKSIWNESGKTGPMPHSFLSRAVYVADTDKQAYEDAAPHLPNAYTYEEDYAFENFGIPYIGGASVSETEVQDSGCLRGTQMFAGMSTGIDFWLEHNVAYVGSPETVIRQLKQAQETIGFDVLGGRFRWGAISDDKVINSLRLFGEKVIPAFADVPTAGRLAATD